MDTVPMCTGISFHYWRRWDQRTSWSKVSFKVYFYLSVASFKKYDQKLKKQIKYEGEVDMQNKMCGHGVQKINGQIVYSGTFYNDQRNGIGKSKHQLDEKW